MPGARVDGNDPEAMRRATAGFVEAARAGKGPALIEAMTQRLVGHYYGDMQTYRPKGELREAQKVEPIVRLRQRMEREGMPPAELDRIESAVRTEIEAAAAEAQAAPLADASKVKEHLYG